MSQLNPFIDLLNRAPAPADHRQPALDVLENLRQAIEQRWLGRLDCTIVLGYPTNFGQEYRIVIRSKRTGYEHTLLRAYIPLMGRPIKLDLYDFEMLDCADPTELQIALLQFLNRTETRDAIETYAGR